MVGVKVIVGVTVAVPVKMIGVCVRVEVSVKVIVGVTLGVKSMGFGASAIAIQPMQ